MVWPSICAHYIDVEKRVLLALLQYGITFIHSQHQQYFVAVTCPQTTVEGTEIP
jgi:hypothetical protein